MGTYGSTKSNVLAIKKESTPGTIVPPAATTDFIALQSDFQMTPNFNVLTNEEIRASIGESKPIQGLEQPQGSFSHYLKHSGTEGTAPEFNDLLEAAFGSTSTNSTQRTTTAASTTTLLKLGAGGSDFARGKAVLVKDAANGYGIRPVDSVSTNDLTLGFPLSAAPLTGLNVGKCINFAPANTGHPTLSLHSYRGNGQLYEILAGALVGSVGISAKAGENINMNFGFQGTKYYFNPLLTSATNKYVDFSDSDGTVYGISVALQYWRDPQELAQAIQDAMNATGSEDTYTVTWMNNDATNAGKFKFASSGTVFVLLNNTGTNTANSLMDLLGFSLAANSTGATFYYSATALTWAAGYTPAYDSTDPLSAKGMEVLLGDGTGSTCFCVNEMTFNLTNDLTNVLCICATSGVDQKKVTKRKVTVSLKALLDKQDSDQFYRYRANALTKFCFNFGIKSGGNWVAGQCGNIYLPTAVVSKFNMIDLDTLIGIEMELTAYVDSSGNGEVYLNFL